MGRYRKRYKTLYVTEGKSVREIAEITGVTTGSVYSWLKRHGVKLRRGELHFSEATREFLTELYHKKQAEKAAAAVNPAALSPDRP